MEVTEVVIKVSVQDSDVDGLKKQINDLNGSIESVETTSKKTGKSVKTNFNDAENSANNLKGGIGGVAEELGTVAKAAKKGGAAMRTALISTGIGALIVGLGIIIDNWKEISRFVGLTNASLEEQADLIDSNISVLDSQLSILKKESEYNVDRGFSNAENLKKQKEILAEKKKLLIQDIKLLEAQLLKEQSVGTELSLVQKLQIAAGLIPDFVDEEQIKRINDLQIRINKLKETAVDIDNITFDLDNPKPKKTKPIDFNAFFDPNFLKKQSELANKIFEDFRTKNNELNDITASDRLKRQRDNAQKELDELIISGEEKLKAQKQLDDFFIQKEFELLEALAQQKQDFENQSALKQAEFEASRIEDPIERLNAERANLEAEREIIEEDLQAKVDLYDEGTIERLNAENALADALQDIDNKITANADANAKARSKIDEIAFKNKMKLLNGVSDGLSAASDILGETTGAGKALAVAASLINTYAAIAGQLKAFAPIAIPGYAIAQAVATGLSGFAAVKNILKVKVPNSKGSSSNSAGGFSAAASAPSFNVVGASETNQLAQTLNQQQDPIQAYVVGSDVTSQQAMDRNIVDTATIG